MKSHALIQTNAKNTFWVLTVDTVMLVGTYVYLLNTAVFNVVKRGAAEKQISAANSKITELETKYISLKNNINLELAYSLGYKEVEMTTFIGKKSVSVANTQSPRE